MKAVVLAGGRGSRLEYGNKCMIRFNNKPILQYSLENALRCDIDEIILLVGYKADKVINYFGTNYHRASISYVFQMEQKGIVHAVDCCREYIGSDDFLLMLGDEIFDMPHHKDMREYFEGNDCFGLCGIVPVRDVSRICKTYSILTSGRDVHRLVEKPSHVFNNMMGTGNCFFKNSILDYIDLTPVDVRRGRSERELVGLIQCAVDDGKRVRWFQVADRYENVNDEDCLKNILDWGGISG